MKQIYSNMHGITNAMLWYIRGQ